MFQFKRKPSLSVSQVKAILLQAKEVRQQRLIKTELEDLELDVVYFHLQQQIRWLSDLELDISALTDPTWTLRDEIQFTEQCEDPGRELCRRNHPTTRMIRIEQLLENDPHFIKQMVYQEVRRVVFQIKELKTVPDPTKDLKKKLEKYLRKRFKLQSSEALDLIVEHYIHARIGVLSYVESYSYEHSLPSEFACES